MPQAIDDSATVRQFVQGFYDWYTPLVVGSRDAERLVADSASRFLEPRLAEAIRDNADARSEPDQVRMSAPFDLFLQTLEACPRYQASSGRRQGPGYMVTVNPVCGGDAEYQMKQQNPVVEVVPVDGKWKIGNVWYHWHTYTDTTYDLKSMLCKYAQEDLRPAKRPTRCDN